MTPRAGDTAPRHDWSARARSTAMEALRYTQFVGVMKRALPAAAFAVIAAVLAFFFVARQPSKFSMTYEKLGSIENDLAMIKPRLTGADTNGNPFVITAKEAVQDAKNPKQATLKTIEADINTKQGWLNARAVHGHVDMAANWLALDGGLDVFTDTGYGLHTERADVDLKRNIVIGNREVTGQGPLGTMRADSFRYDHVAGRMTLAGHVQTVFNGKGK